MVPFRTVVVLSVLGANGAAGASNSTSDESSLIGTGFELLDMVEAGADPMGTVRVATDQSSFEQLWSDTSIAQRPEFVVDFETSVVVSFTIPDDACPPILTDFDRSDDVWSPIFTEPMTTCQQPLIPKIYVVAVDRATLAHSVTFRLPADPLFFDTDGTATVVGANTPTKPTSTNPTPTSDVIERSTPVGVFGVPVAGDAVSVQLDDGFPIWLVVHDDGSLSALPGIVESDSTPVNPAEDTIRVVSWLPQARQFSGQALHDEWGRTLNDGRHHDLGGFVTTTHDGDVTVYRNDASRVSGQPYFDRPREMDGFIRPTLRSPSEQPGPGWWQLAANVITGDGEARICTNPDPTPCPPEAPLAPNPVALEPGVIVWQEGPVVVHVDSDGHIDEIAILGGSLRTN